MPGLVPGTHVPKPARCSAWMAGPGPAPQGACPSGCIHKVENSEINSTAVIWGAAPLRLVQPHWARRLGSSEMCQCGGRHHFSGTAAFHPAADQSVRVVVPQLRATSGSRQCFTLEPAAGYFSRQAALFVGAVTPQVAPSDWRPPKTSSRESRRAGRPGRTLRYTNL
jgi:hypothetical protein